MAFLGDLVHTAVRQIYLSFRQYMRGKFLALSDLRKIMKFAKHASLIAVIVSVSACGGGDGGAPSSGTSTPSGGAASVTGVPASNPPAADSAQVVATPPPAGTQLTTGTPPPAATQLPSAAVGLPSTFTSIAAMVNGTKIKAVSDLGVSADAISTIPNSWAVSTSAAKSNLFSVRSVRLINSKYIMLGEFTGTPGGARILTSIDGDSWSEATIPTDSPLVLWDVAGSPGRYVAVAQAYVFDSNGATVLKPAMLESTDALTWRAVSQANLQGKSWVGIAYGNGTFVAANQAGETAWSNDGLNWTIQQTSLVSSNGFFPALRQVSYSPSLQSFVAGSNVRNEGGFDIGHVYVSANGKTNWIKRNTGVNANILRVECGTSKCVASTSAGAATPSLLTSTDLITWRQTATSYGSTLQYVFGLANSTSGWVATGSQGLLLTSPDGETWTKTAAR
jgi:hypothetical protein